MTIKKYKLGLLILIVISAISIGFINFDDKNFQIAKNLDIYHTLFRELNLYYVDETDPGQLVKNSIDKMLETLDPYTVYIPESQMEDFRFMTTGKYGGIGALIRQAGNYVMVAEPYEGFPAHKAGLKAGDTIYQIDGNSTKGKTSDEISELLKGDPNTPLQIAVKRGNNDKLLTFNIKREKISIKSVPYYGMLNNNTGYIRLNSFTENCSNEVKEALLDLKNNHAMENLVFDLRGNPGGLLHEAVNVSNLFLPKGQEIVSTKGKVKQWNRTYTANNDPIDLNIPVVVLVNRGSASASEIVSGAIQDLDRGVVIGSRTFGKGLVQTTRDLSYNTKLKLTTAKYYIPSGRCIQALDYSHRNDDGSVGRVPDSLITEFKTKGGRKVFDGGGVLPDILIEPKEMSNISISLYTKNLIFDYATYFESKNDSIALPGNFKINDSIYNDFIAFLSDKTFDYTLESEEIINNLEEAVKNDRYQDKVGNLLTELRTKLAHDKNEDLKMFRDEISLLLHDEIVSRYYYQKGRAQSALIDDPAIDSALMVFNNNKYQTILQKTN